MFDVFPTQEVLTVIVFAWDLDGRRSTVSWASVENVSSKQGPFWGRMEWTFPCEIVGGWNIMLLKVICDLCKITLWFAEQKEVLWPRLTLIYIYAWLLYMYDNEKLQKKGIIVTKSLL